MHFDPTLWLPVFAALLAAILHSLSADGGASIFDHFGSSYRLSKPWLPAFIVLATVGTGLVDALKGGADLQQSLAAAAAVGISAIFGAVAHHAVASGKASASGAAKGLLMLVGAGLVALSVQACALFTHEARSVLEDVGVCLSENQDLPDDQALLKCGIDAAASEAEKQAALNVLHSIRAATAQHMAEAVRMEQMTGCAGTGAK